MTPITSAPTLPEALRAATETRSLEISAGALSQVPRIFREQFGGREAMVVADTHTLAAAGRRTLEALRAAHVPVTEPFVFRAPDLFAGHRFVEELETTLKKNPAIPIAVGSGTINDLTKLASHRTGRPYMSVATAASMDGYTAYGASITWQGSKQTFLCPAPAAVVADLEVIGAAPVEMNSWGYADLLAKITAGADWILADTLEVEPIHRQAWEIAQGRLRHNLSEPAGVRSGDSAALERLVEGLMLGGFAMQASKSSRCASGAEHQFSHLWDMQHHTHQGRAPSHGFKVGIGTLAVAAFYERLLEKPLDQIDAAERASQWPAPEQWQAEARQLFQEPTIAAVAMEEILAKSAGGETLRAQLRKLRQLWPDLRQRLREQLMPFAVIRQMLQAAGAPVEPEQIGLSRRRLRDSFRPAFFLRRRFTVLDLAERAGVFDHCLDEVFGPGGPWPL